MSEIVNTEEERSSMTKDLVRFSNELIKTPFDLSKNERAVVLFALSCANGYQPNPGKIKFPVEDFANKLDMINPDENYTKQINRIRRTLKEVLSTLLNKTVTSNYFDADEGLWREKKVQWINELDSPIDLDDGDFIIEFAAPINPFLFDLKANYSEFKLGNIPREDAAAFSINMLLLKGQFLQFDWLKVKRENTTFTTTADIDSLRIFLNLEGKYLDWRDFRKRIIIPAVDEINEKSDITVLYEPLRVGRKITRIKFVHIFEKSLGDKPKKPTRPRLVKRKSFIAGSHAEGQWKKQNFHILRDYRDALKTYDPKSELTKADIQRLVTYSELFSLSAYEEAKTVLDKMNEKSAKRKKAKIKTDA